VTQKGGKYDTAKIDLAAKSTNINFSARESGTFVRNVHINSKNICFQAIHVLHDVPV